MHGHNHPISTLLYSRYVLKCKLFISREHKCTAACTVLMIKYEHVTSFCKFYVPIESHIVQSRIEVYTIAQEKIIDNIQL